jgi:hypothetical protein
VGPALRVVVLDGVEIGVNHVELLQPVVHQHVAVHRHEHRAREMKTLVAVVGDAVPPHRHILRIGDVEAIGGPVLCGIFPPVLVEIVILDEDVAGVLHVDAPPELGDAAVPYDHVGVGRRRAAHSDAVGVLLGVPGPRDGVPLAVESHSRFEPEPNGIARGEPRTGAQIRGHRVVRRDGVPALADDGSPADGSASGLGHRDEP